MAGSNNRFDGRSFPERSFGSINERVIGYALKYSTTNLFSDTVNGPCALSIARTIIPASSDLPLYLYGVCNSLLWGSIVAALEARPVGWFDQLVD